MIGKHRHKNASNRQQWTIEARDRNDRRQWRLVANFSERDDHGKSDERSKQHHKNPASTRGRSQQYAALHKFCCFRKQFWLEQRLQGRRQTFLMQARAALDPPITIARY